MPIEMQDEATFASRHEKVVGLLRELLDRYRHPLDDGSGFATKEKYEKYLHETGSWPADQPLLVPEGAMINLRQEMPNLPPLSLAQVISLLELSEGERAFLQATADARHKPAELACQLMIFADWLEEQGRSTEGGIMRRLVPQTGDVLVFTHSGLDPVLRKDLDKVAETVLKYLEQIGREVFVIVTSNSCDLNLWTPSQLVGAGLARLSEVDRLRREVARLQHENAELQKRTRPVEFDFNAPFR